MRSFVAPGLSLNSFSFIVQILGRRVALLAPFRVNWYAVLFDDADQMRNFIDHATDRRVVGDDLAAVHLIQAEADERLALIERPADRAADLLDRQRFLCGCLRGFSHRYRLPYASAG